MGRRDGVDLCVNPRIGSSGRRNLIGNEPSLPTTQRAQYCTVWQCAAHELSELVWVSTGEAAESVGCPLFDSRHWHSPPLSCPRQLSPSRPFLAQAPSAMLRTLVPNFRDISCESVSQRDSAIPKYARSAAISTPTRATTSFSGRLNRATTPRTTPSSSGQFAPSRGFNEAWCADTLDAGDCHAG